MDLRATAKQVAWKVAPVVMADRARDFERGLRRRTTATAIAERFLSEHGDRVLEGPLQGLRLAANRIDEIDAPVAKLLGSYEQEIHAALSAAMDSGPARFVDLGAADGYFAVGVAHVAQMPVDAFDLSRSARSLIEETARLNNVTGLVRTHGAATPRSVEALPLERAMVLCDIEGAERNLFSRALVENLGTAHVIVEMHSKVHSDVESVLAERFAVTHDVHVVEAVRRDPAMYPALETLDDAEDRDHAVNELRYRFDGLRWLVAQPY